MFIYQMFSQIISHKFEAKAKPNETITPGQFWTSGTDQECTSAYGWCAVNKLVRGAVWDSGKPDASKNCIATNIDGKNTTLITADCAFKMRYICEVQRHNLYINMFY